MDRWRRTRREANLLRKKSLGKIKPTRRGGTSEAAGKGRKKREGDGSKS